MNNEKIFQSLNPWSGELLAEWEVFSPAKVHRILQLSRAVFPQWRGEKPEFRLRLMDRLAILLEKNREMLALAMAEEMGKPVTEGRSEVDKSVAMIRYLQENLLEWTGIEDIQKNSIPVARKLLEPLGGILLIMPWNFPLWQVCRAALPALCAGNVVLLKHAPNVFRFSSILGKLFSEAGFPEGVFQEIRVDTSAVEGIIADQAVAAVSLTGSEAAGSAVASIAGKYLKKCILELGGSDPFIVMKDADLEAAARTAAMSRMINGGQSCIAAKRFLIHRDVAELFSMLLIQKLSDYKPGNPCFSSTRLGPLARPDLLDNLRRQYAESIRGGAVVRYEMKAEFPEKAPVFLPVLLENVQPGMAAFDEETFGPLVSLTRFSTDEELISLANNTRFGLGATIFTADRARAWGVAGSLACGSVAINQLMRSDPALPFGGIKASGYGKELAREGFEAFCNEKVVMMQGS